LTDGGLRELGATVGHRFADAGLLRAAPDRNRPVRVGRAVGYARRFAAKEACSKALGTGMRAGVF